MVKRELPLEHDFKIFKQILQIQRMWPYFDNMSDKRKRFLNILSNIALILEIHLTIVTILDLILVKPYQGITEKLKAVVECLVLIIALIQVGVFRSKHCLLKKMEKVVESFRLPCPFQTCDKLTIDQLKFRYRILYWACVMFSLGVCAANTTNFIGCIILRYFYNKRTLPSDSWYMFDSLKTPVFEILLVLQFLGQEFAGQTFGCTFLHFLSYSIMIYHQLKILNQYLRNIVNVTLLELGISNSMVQQFDLQVNELLHERPNTNTTRNINILKISEIFEKENKLFNQYKFQEKLYENYKKCIKHHQSILTAADILEDTLQLLFLINMCFTTGFLSIFLFLLIYVSDMQNIVIKFAQYMYLEVIAWFIYGFLGSLLTYESQKVVLANYEIPWYLLDNKILTSMKFMIMRSFKPITITSGKVTIVSLELCIKISNTDITLTTYYGLFNFEYAPRNFTTLKVIVKNIFLSRAHTIYTGVLRKSLSKE